MKTINRQRLLRDGLRAGVLAGIIGWGAVLTSRKQKFECSSQCGHCPKLENGKCGLGLK